jgi:ring-1,2-phenylacetyl-CoA epoxidase subunit PaaB
MSEKEWPLYEVFIRSRAGWSPRHAGRVHAADPQLALDHARDVYTRRNEGVSSWVVRSSEIIASDPADSSALFEPAADKIYRHPTFYEIPDGVENI